MKKVLQGLELLLILLFLLLGGSVIVGAVGIMNQLGQFANWQLITLTIIEGTLLIINAVLMLINFWHNNLQRIIQLINGLILIIAIIGLILFGSFFSLHWLAAIGLVLYSILFLSFR